MKFTTQPILASLFMIALFAACSRPVAYLQPSAREHFTTTSAKSPNVTKAPTSVITETPTMAINATSAEQLSQAKAALDQVDAMVRNDSKMASNKTVQKRLNRIRTLMAATSAKASLTPNATNGPRKMNLVERLVVKKMNKKISKQLAPANPDKAMAITGVLALGAVLVLGGLLVTLLTTGTGVTIGVIMIVAGLVCLLIGLL